MKERKKGEVWPRDEDLCATEIERETRIHFTLKIDNEQESVCKTESEEQEGDGNGLQRGV